MIKTTFLLIFLMTILGAFAGFFLKKASENLKLPKLLLNYNLYVGALLYLTAAVLNIYVLQKLDYSLVLPLTSITYIWTMIISYLFLKEKISKSKIIGVICIMSGAIIISLF